MYENVTFETILQRMLAHVPNDLDKRESSVLYNALAPAAVELQLMYIELDYILKETFADSASRQGLIKRAAERGLKPLPATKAILKGVFEPPTAEIKIGARFSGDELNYVVTKRMEAGVYQFECEQIGSKGNLFVGSLVPIDYINGLETGKLTELIIPGEDEEETEAFRKRYFDSLQYKSYGGNISDYKEKVNSIPGVGGVKVYPVWNGGGTVKLVIQNSEYLPPTEEQIQSIQTLVDPIVNQGEGLGFAPIGHRVTVESVMEEPILLQLELSFSENRTFETEKTRIENAINEYFSSLRKTWQETDQTIIRVSQIESKILSLEGIVDIVARINGQSRNLTLSKDSLPILSEVAEWIDG